MTVATMAPEPRTQGEAESIGELSRRLGYMEANLRTDIRALDTKVSTQMVTHDTFDGKMGLLELRVRNLETSKSSWAARWWAMLVVVIAAMVTGGIDLAAHLMH